MKKLILLTAIVVSSLTAPLTVKSAGIPVFDASSLAQAVEEFQNSIEQLKELKEQVATAKQTLDTMKDPRQVAQLLQSIASDFANLDSGTKAILDQYGLEVPKYLSGEDAEDYKEDIDRTSEWLAKVEEFEKGTEKRQKQLEELQMAINTTPDVKMSADLGNRINAETVATLNEIIKLQSSQQEANVKKELASQKAWQQSLDRINEPIDNYYKN